MVPTYQPYTRADQQAKWRQFQAAWMVQSPKMVPIKHPTSGGVIWEVVGPLLTQQTPLAAPLDRHVEPHVAPGATCPSVYCMPAQAILRVPLPHASPAAVRMPQHAVLGVPPPHAPPAAASMPPPPPKLSPVPAVNPVDRDPTALPVLQGNPLSVEYYMKSDDS